MYFYTPHVKRRKQISINDMTTHSNVIYTNMCIKVVLLVAYYTQKRTPSYVLGIQLILNKTAYIPIYIKFDYSKWEIYIEY